MADLQAQIERAEARAEALRNAKRDRAARLRQEHPDFARFVDDYNRVFGWHATVVNGERYGQAPLPDRRSGSVGYIGLPLSKSDLRQGENRRVHRDRTSTYQRALEAALSAGEGDDDRE